VNWTLLLCSGSEPKIKFLGKATIGLPGYACPPKSRRQTRGMVKAVRHIANCTYRRIAVANDLFDGRRHLRIAFPATKVSRRRSMTKSVVSGSRLEVRGSLHTALGCQSTYRGIVASWPVLVQRNETSRAWKSWSCVYPSLINTETDMLSMIMTIHKAQFPF
jgi:hypothetical protein